MLHTIEKIAIKALREKDARLWNALYDEFQKPWECDDPLCDCRIVKKQGLVSQANLK